MGLSSETRFGFGDCFWLRAFVPTPGKALRMQECVIVLGSGSFRKSVEKSGSTVRSAGKVEKYLFLLLARESSQGKERLTY